MARNDFPDDPNNYSDAGDPTRYANYGGTGGEAYSEYGTAQHGGYLPQPEPVPPRQPWYQHPAALVGLGVLTAALIVLLVFAVVRFTTAENSTPAVTTTSSSTSTTPTSPTTTSQTATSQTATTETAAPAPTSTEQPTTTTTTVAPTTTPTTTAAPTTTTAPPTTTAPSVTTITETTTKRLWPTLPTLRPPTLYEPPPGQ